MNSIYQSGPGFWGDSIFDVNVSTTWSKTGDIYHDFRDYRTNWTSSPTTIQDNRLTLNYQWVSEAEDITGLRPKFDTYETEAVTGGMGVNLNKTNLLTTKVR